jgi:hypothetical protein
MTIKRGNGGFRRDEKREQRARTARLKRLLKKSFLAEDKDDRG